MTVLESEPPTPTSAPGSGRRRPFPAFWGAPLWAHAALLAVALAVLLPAMHPDSAFTSDEGAYALQTRALERGSWAYEYKAREFDPEGRNFPLVLSDRSGPNFFPYIKHPAYPLVLRASTAVAGRTVGLHLVALLGVLGTAVAAWLLAGELGPRLRRPAFWAAAASPVLVSGYLIWAHAPSAALGGLSTVAAVRIARRGLTPWLALGATASLAGGVLLRSEGLLLAGALAVAVAVVRLREVGGIRALASFSLLAGPALAVALVERAWIRSIVGGGYESLQSKAGGSSGVGARLGAAWHELFDSAFEQPGAALLGLATLAVILVLGVLALHRPHADSRRHLTVAVVAAVFLTTVRYLRFPDEAVTGLFAAWPVALLGLLLVRWRSDDDGSLITVLLGVATATFGLAILATQYEAGGGLEWGGRFFSPAVVAIAVLATAGFDRARQRFDARTRRSLGALIAVLALTGAVLGLATVGTARARHARVVAAIARGATPVVVTNGPSVARIAWRTDGRLTWMLAPESDFPEVLRTLGDAGLPEVTLVISAHTDAGKLGAFPTIREASEPALRELGLRMLTLRTS